MMHAVSHDPTLRETVELASGDVMTPLEIPVALFDLARKYADERGSRSSAPNRLSHRSMERWETVSRTRTRSRDPQDAVDWVAKYELMDAYCARHNCDLTDPRVHALDLQYHDLRPERSLFQRLGMDRIVSDETSRQRSPIRRRPTGLLPRRSA